MPDYKIHPIINPTGESSSKFDFQSGKEAEDPIYQQKLKNLRDVLTHNDVANILSGAYGHTSLYLDDIKAALAGHKHLNTKSVDKAIEKMAHKSTAEGDNKTSEDIKRILEHFDASPEKIHEIIDSPERYGMYRQAYDRNRTSTNEMASILSSQKNFNKDHANKILDGSRRDIKIDEEFLKHPVTQDPEIKEKIYSGDNHKLTHSAMEMLADQHISDNIFGNKADKIIPKIIKNHRSTMNQSTATMDKLLSAMSPEGRNDYLNKILGIHDGEHVDDEMAASPDENYNNWNPGNHHDSRLMEHAAGSRHLSDAQADHILRHADDFDTRWNLFNNSHISNKHADAMYNKWMADDSGHGFDKDNFKEKLKEENSYEDQSDDWYEDAREAVEEDNPFSSYVKDNYPEEELMGQDKEDWIDDHLERNHDWYHTPEKDPSSDKEPEEIDYSGRDKEDHPEYQSRYDDAETEWDNTVKRAYEDPREALGDRQYERLLDSYDDYIRDDIHDRARDLYDNHMETAHENPDYLPSHLSNVQELRRKATEEKAEEARKKAAEKEAQDKIAVDKYIPNRPTEHHYGEGQHHLEMAKEYADANGGQIDIGHLNKVHPNMVEKWKRIFGGKGKISSEEIQSKIDATPKTKYNMSYGHWKPDDMQNVNGQDEMVIRLDHSPESLEELKKDPEAFDVFAKINEAAQRSGHPTNANTIGWVRADFTDPKRPMIDELQSDFGSAARDYLKEHGGETGEQKAKHLDKIINIQKNWREVMLNAVKKIAKDNGADALFTHSPESKSAHTGASKVHSVYKDSYEKIPRQLGFKSVGMEHMPLSEEGQKTFRTKRSGTDPAELMEQHLNGAAEHAFMAESHRFLADNRPEDHETHSKMADMHDSKFKEHLERAKTIDPSHSVRNVDTAKKMTIFNLSQNRILGSDEEKIIRNQKVMDASNHAKALKSGTMNSIPVYGFDSALKQQPATEEGHSGHMLPLNQAAFKKHIMVADLLMKSEMKDDDKIAVAQALMNIQQQQEQINQLQQTNPEGYKTIVELTQVLVDLFKELNDEPVDAVIHELEAQGALPQEESSQEMQGPASPQYGGVTPPPQEQPITHGSKTLPPGVIRRYDNQTAREKLPDGNWVSVQGGQKRYESE